MPKRSIYFADEIESVININPDQTPESYSGRVGFLIQAASITAAEQCPALPIAVWCALADANNGTFHTYEHGAAAVVSGVSLNLLDADCQFDIDPQEWGLKIRKMSFAEQFAIFEVVRRFWLDKETVNSCKDYTEVFRKLGGKVAEDEGRLTSADCTGKIAKSAWKLSERTEGESIAYVTRGPWEGLEIAVDWSQGWNRPATKAERLASIIEDESLVAEHQRLFLERRAES